MKKRVRADNDEDNGFGQWGGYMGAKIAKLEEQFAIDAAKNPYKESNLFTGISIFVNGLTNPSSDELKRIMMTHGGVFHTYHKSSTTFMIASNLPDVKIRQITTCKIISPQWVVDCLKENRILDYSKYLLYTNASRQQPKLQFTKVACDVNVKEKQHSDEGSKQATVVKGEQTIKEKKENIKEDNESGVDLNSSIVVGLNALNTLLREENIGNLCETQPSNATTKPEVNLSNSKSNAGLARTAVDPNFLSEFYNNSRLHHIATLGASFKHYISQLRDSHDGSFPERLKLKIASSLRSSRQSTAQGKSIMHIDMDCFFVSVGLRTRPQLRGHPIAVTHSKGANANQIKQRAGADRQKEMELYARRHDDRFKQRGIEDDDDDSITAVDNTTSLSEIASCSYEARKMGVKNGMFVGAALKLCPNLKTIPYDFEGYKEVAQTLYDTIARYTLDIEAVSCDEMYADLTELLREVQMSTADFVTHIRQEIINRTGCPCSVGVGQNRLQARMATKRAKPNGQYFLEESYVEEYFRDIAISDLPGVGYSTTTKLNQLQWSTCSDLQHMPLVKIQQELGKKLGETLYNYCRGIDNKPLAYDQIRKSVSAEVNYGIRFSAESELDTFLRQLCTEVHNRLADIRSQGKTITLKYMVRAKEAPVETAKFMGHGFCDHVTKSTTLSSYTCDLDIIMQTVFAIKNNLNIPPSELRGIGIQISKLSATKPGDTTKSNVLRNMFERASKKAEAKKIELGNEIQSKSTTIIPKPNATVDVGRTTAPIKNKRGFRKAKSFNSGSADIAQMFNAMPSQQKRVHKMFQELDLDVLAELPEDIREQVLKEQKIALRRFPSNKSIEAKNEPKNISKSLKNGETDTSTLNENGAQTPSTSFHQIQSLMPRSKISKDNVLLQPKWYHTLTAWQESTENPSDCDMNLITKYFEELLEEEMLSDVHLRLRYLHRTISPRSCHWHAFHKHINNVVQLHVKKIHGNEITLRIENDIPCDHCKN